MFDVIISKSINSLSQEKYDAFYSGTLDQSNPISQCPYDILELIAINLIKYEIDYMIETIDNKCLELMEKFKQSVEYEFITNAIKSRDKLIKLLGPECQDEVYSQFNQQFADYYSRMQAINSEIFECIDKLEELRNKQDNR